MVTASQKKIRELKKAWALTWEGLSIDKENLDALDKYFTENNIWNKELNEATLYTWTGDTFNKMYKLTDTNAYPLDCTFVAIEQDTMSCELMKARLNTGARWLPDIVTNNAARQRVINKRK